MTIPSKQSPRASSLSRVLLCSGAYNLHLADLRANLAPIALLALPSVVATASLVGAALHLAAGLAWLEALLYSCVLMKHPGHSLRR